MAQRKKYKKTPFKKRRKKRKVSVRKPSRDFGDSKYKEWREKVLARDSFHCQWPGCKNHAHLQVHHILKYADFPHLRYEVHNGITLCSRHHTMIKNKEEEFAYFFCQLIVKQAENK